MLIMLYIYSHIDVLILIIYYIVIVLMENLGFQQKTVSFVVLILLEIGNHLIQGALYIYQQYFQKFTERN